MSPSTVLNFMPECIFSATFLGSSDFAASAACLMICTRGVAVERVGFRLELLGAELRDDVLGRRVVARIGAVGHQRAFDARAADRGELVGGDAVAAHQRRLDALVAHLAHDQAAFGVQAAPIDEVGAGLLDLGDQRRKSFSPVLTPS